MHPPGAQTHMQGPGAPGQQQFQRLKVSQNTLLNRQNTKTSGTKAILMMHGF